MIYNQKPANYGRRTLSATVSKQKLDVLKPQERLLNLQKREKLKELLIIKFNKKYGITNSEPIIETEIGNFLQREKLTDAELQRLEAKIQRLIYDKKAKENLVNTLKRDNTQPQLFNKLNEDKPEQETQIEVQNTASSKKKEDQINKATTPKNNTLRPFSSQCGSKSTTRLQRKQYKTPQEELAELEAEEAAELAHIASNKQNEERLDFSSEGDEWNAIAQYNKKKFENEKITERLKDKAIQRRTKEDLDLQIKQKVKNEYDSHLQSLECNAILMKHLEHLKVLEKEKELAFKQQVLREKADREIQVQDEQARKRIEILKQKKLDKEYLRVNEAQIEKEKQAILLKKKKANDALHAGLKENEIAKKRRAESLKQEKLDEMRSCEEYGRTEEKKDNERREYFNRIERNGNKFTATKVEKVLEEMKKKDEDEEEKRKQCTIDKEARDQADEDKKKSEIQHTKKFLRSYYDMQVEEKKKAMDFEKQIEYEQGRIWKRDIKDFHEQERDINQRIRKMNRMNFDKVMGQIEAKKNKKGINQKMTKEEYLMNKKLLEEVKNYK